MKKLLSFLFIAQLSSSFGQITINSSDFISGEDTVMITSVNDFQNIDYTTTGANSVWDFSNVVIDTQQIDSFFNMSTAGITYQLIFNNFLNPDYDASYYKKEDDSFLPTTLPLSISNPVSFYKLSSDKLERVGYGADLSGNSLPVPADTIDEIYRLPMTFQDAWNSNSYIYLDINPIFNAQFKRHQSRVAEVDGYGTITTPFGTFDAIRVKSTLSFTDSINIDLFNTGGTWNAIPSNDIVEYRWWAKNSKVPVFSINTSLSLIGETVTSVEYRDDEINFASVMDQPLFTTTLYPNPASNFIHINSNFDNMAVQCFSSTGSLVYNNETQTGSFLINSEAWESGIYFINLTIDNKTEVHKIIIR